MCQFKSVPTDVHLIATKRILRYVNGTLHYGVFLQLGPLSLSTFSNSDWAKDPFDRRSITGYMVYLGYNPITWSAKKQETISRSSTKPEYRALATTTAELSWLCQVLKDLGVFPLLNSGVIMLLHLPLLPILSFMLTPNMWRWITTLFEKGCFVDIFTKSLSTSCFVFLRSKIMVFVNPMVLRGDVKVSTESQRKNLKIEEKEA